MKRFAINASQYTNRDLRELRYIRNKLSDMMNDIMDLSNNIYDMIDGDSLIDDLRDKSIQIQDIIADVIYDMMHSESQS